MSKNIKNSTLPAPKEGKRKKWTKKKIIAASILGTAVLCFVIFAIIMLVMYFSGVRPIKSTEEEARVVGEVDGYEVRYEELRYITLLHRQSLDTKYGKYDTLDASGKKAYEEELQTLVLNDVENNYVILSLCEDYDIDTDSKNAKDYVQDEIESFVESNFDGDVDAYKAWLAENKLTDAFLRLTYRTYYLEQELYTYFVENKIGIAYDDESRDKFCEYVMDEEGSSWIRTIHLFYPKKSDYYDTSKSLESAENALAQLRGITDGEERHYFMEKSLIGKAPMIEGYSTTGNGFYFTFGAMGERYESAAFALDVYDVSDVVETDEGYYVIMRVPMDERHVKLQAEELLDQYRYASLKKQMDSKREKISFDGNDYFDGRELIDLK